MLCSLAFLAAACSNSNEVVISADQPPTPTTWPAYPKFPQASCWARPTSAAGISRVAPSVPVARSKHPTPPAEIARRLLARFGDRSFIRRIEFGRPPPRRQIRGFFRANGPPGDALWAYISAPLSVPFAAARISPSEARARSIAQWQLELVGGALRDDICRAGGRSLAGWSVSDVVRGVSDGTFAFNQRFPNPSKQSFRARVATVGERYGFQASSIRFLHPEELVPIVVVETDRDRKEFVADVREIMALLDPTSSSLAQTAVTFEGFLFEARDRHGPFVRIFNAYRGESMGGQWSWNRHVYPYEHG